MLLFMYFGCLIANRNNESGHPSLILDLRGKNESLNIKCDISYRFLVDPFPQVDKIPSAIF